MPIQTNTRGGSGAAAYPSLKFIDVGDKAVIRLCHASVVTKFRFGSNPPAPELKADGTEKKQVKLIGKLMTSGRTSHREPDGRTVEEVLEVGTTVVYYISGHNRYTDDVHRQSWGQATDTYGHEPFIGDVIRLRRDGDEPGMGAEPKRCMWFEIVAQDPSTDAAAIAEAEQLYHEIAGTPHAATGVTPAPAVAGWDTPAPVTVLAGPPPDAGWQEEKPF